MATQANVLPLGFHVARKEISKLPDGSSPLATFYMDDFSFYLEHDKYTICNLIMITDKTEFEADERCLLFRHSENGKTIYVRVARNTKDSHIIGIEHTVTGVHGDESMVDLVEYILMHVFGFIERLDKVITIVNRENVIPNDPLINYTLNML